MSYISCKFVIELEGDIVSSVIMDVITYYDIVMCTHMIRCTNITVLTEFF